MTFDWEAAASSTPTPPPPRHWMRVSPARRCPICGKADWCSLGEDGVTACCMRISEGASQQVDLGHGVGFIHRLDGTTMQPSRRTAPVCTYVPESTRPFRLDYDAIFRRWRATTPPNSIDHLAESLGVSRVSLDRLGVVRCSERKAWAFPMHDAIRRVVGVRLRTDDNFKFALPGSHSGLFMPAGLESKTRLLICEGPTDTAAALTLGFDAVGRPSCSGGSEYLCDLLQVGKWRDVVIIADSDQPNQFGIRPGRYGANQLADRLLGICASVKIIETTPHKDLRDWLRAGCKQVSLLHLIERTPARVKDHALDQG